MPAPSFVLVPGAWHGAWCFDLLVHELRRRAVRCVCVDLPALGDDATPAAEATFEQGVERVLQACAGREKLRLVGHSFGTLYTTEAALRAPARPHRLIHLAGWVPRAGDSFSALAEVAPVDAEFRATFRRTEDGAAHELPVESAQRWVYSDVPESFATLAATRLRPQPLGPMRDAAVRDAPETLAQIRQRVIVAEEDRVLAPDALVALAERAELTVETIPHRTLPVPVDAEAACGLAAGGGLTRTATESFDSQHCA